MHVVTVEHALYGSPTQLAPASAAQKDTAHELQVDASEAQFDPPSAAPPLLLVPELLPPLELLASELLVTGVGLLLLLQAATRAAPDAIANDATVALRS